MSPDPANRLLTHDVTERFVDSKTQFFLDVQLWPLRQHMDPHAWLKNFTAHERPFALNLLNVFLYYNEPLVDALLYGAVQRLSAPIVQTTDNLRDARNSWRDFLDSLLITYVEGEIPNPADSGFLFARKARQVLSIPEEHIMPPSRALATLLREPQTPLLFVDDFVGTGNQMVSTWSRSHPPAPTTFHSVAELSPSIFYVPLIATKTGINALTTQCPGLRVCPAHVLDDRYSLTSTRSIFWPDALKPDARSFLLEASRRAGIVDSYKYGWQGFHDLALPLAFYHCVPDATLPLFFWDQHGWQPLIRRA